METVKGTPARENAAESASSSSSGSAATTVTPVPIVPHLPLQPHVYAFQAAADAAKDVHHYDNRKYQLVYILAAVLVSVAFNLQAVGNNGLHPAYVLAFVLQGSAITLLGPLIFVLQRYTRTWGNLRRKLDALLLQRITCEIDDAAWEAGVRSAVIAAFEENRRAKREHPRLFWLVDRIF